MFETRCWLPFALDKLSLLGKCIKRRTDAPLVWFVISSFPTIDMNETAKYNYYQQKKLAIIKAPVSAGQGKAGVDDGPDKMLEFGLEKSLEELGWSTAVVEPLQGLDISSYNQDEIINNLKNVSLVSDSCERLFNAVDNAHQQGQFPLTIGGDHSIGMATVAAFIKNFPEGGVIWVDAHADINTPSTTDSGNIHGLPVSFPMKLESELWPKQFDWIKNLKNTLPSNKIVYIGLRDVDAGEKKILRDNNILAFSMYHVDKYGINEVIQRAIKHINPEGKNAIHLSYDVDSIDPLYVPATGTPVRGGLTLREGLFICEELALSGHLAGLDVVEVNPALAAHELHAIDTVSTGVSIAKCSLGDTLL